MAELRSSTSIGGNLVWHSGNLRFETQGETIRYSGFKIYTEHDKPDPHTDLTTSVVKRSGDTMTGALRITNSGEQLDLTNTAFGSTDSWISMGNGKADTSYAWQIRYMGTGSGVGSNELRFGSTYGANPKYWQMDHSGNFEYYNGANTYTMLHTGNINNTLDSRYVNTAGDTMTGTLNVPTLHITSGMIQVDHTGTSSDTLISMVGTMEQGASMYINNGGGDNIMSFTKASATKSIFNTAVFGTLTATSHVAGKYVSGERLYAAKDRSAGYFFNDSGTRTSYTGGDFYIQSGAPTTYIYSSKIYLGNTSGSTVYFRGNAISATDWNFSSSGVFTTSKPVNVNQVLTVTSAEAASGLRSTGATATLLYLKRTNNTHNVSIRMDSTDKSRWLGMMADGELGWHTNADVNSGNKFLHEGNINTQLDGRYVNTTGDTMTGTLTGTNIRAQNFQDRSGRRLIDIATDNILRIGNSSSAETHTRIHGSGTGGKKLSIWEGSADQWVFNDNYHPNADKWTTARTLTLNGDVSGSVSMDGSANVTLATTIADNSHNHTTLDNITKLHFKVAGSSDGGHIEAKGGSNDGYLRFSTYDDNGTEYMEFGDYDTSAVSSTFTRWMKLVRGSAEFTGTLSTTGNATIGGDLTVNGGDVTINSNQGIAFNDSSAYWLKVATNWGLYWNTSTNSFEYKGGGTTQAAIDLDNGNVTTNGEVAFATSMTKKASVAYNATTNSIDFNFV